MTPASFTYGFVGSCATKLCPLKPRHHNNSCSSQMLRSPFSPCEFVTRNPLSEEHSPFLPKMNITGNEVFSVNQTQIGGNWNRCRLCLKASLSQNNV
jgi:hypothetical protein